jgi:hypothetical protein
MNLAYHYHRHSNLLTEEEGFKEDYQELVYALETISDMDLVNGFLARKEQRATIKSLSEPINILIKERLVKLGWNAESGLFKEAPYDRTNSTRWRLDFAKNNISVEVAFNHAEAIPHNIIKPVLASELNHVQKEIQTRLGIIITATENMRSKGNFDGAVGTFEKYIEYFKPYSAIVPTPIVLIGIEAPEIFLINQKKEVQYIK